MSVGFRGSAVALPGGKRGARVRSGSACFSASVLCGCFLVLGAWLRAWLRACVGGGGNLLIAGRDFVSVERNSISRSSFPPYLAVCPERGYFAEKAVRSFFEAGRRCRIGRRPPVVGRTWLEPLSVAALT